MNFYLCHGSVDMRKGIVSLSELVRRTMNASPENGDVFIFLGKDRRNLKILRHESNGYVLYWKKLDRFFVKFGGNLFFISTVFLFFFLNPIKSCRYVCFLVTLKTPHH